MADDDESPPKDAVEEKDSPVAAEEAGDAAAEGEDKGDDEVASGKGDGDDDDDDDAKGDGDDGEDGAKEGAEGGDGAGAGSGDAEAATPAEGEKRKRKKKKYDSDDEDDDGGSAKKKKSKKNKNEKLLRIATGQKDESKKSKKKKKKTEDADAPVKKGTAKRIKRTAPAGPRLADDAMELDDDDEGGGRGGRPSRGALDDEDFNELPGEDDFTGHPEAIEEDDEIERLFGKKGKKKKEVDTQLLNKQAIDFVTLMERAAQNDADTVKNNKGIPVKKIKMLKEAEDFLNRTQNHEALLENNVLGAICSWLVPLPDKSLPNLNVRTMLFKALMNMPIDTGHMDRREQLKKSDLGKYIKFYSLLPHETPENRRMASKLVEKWSRPIYNIQQHFGAAAERDDEGRHQAVEEERVKKSKAAKTLDANLDDFDEGGGGAAARKQKEKEKRDRGDRDGAEKGAGDKKSAAGGPDARDGPPVIRKRALPPEMANMDYSVLPASKVDVEELPELDKQKLQAQRGGVRLLEKIAKIPSGGGRRAVSNVKVSVEGRGLVIRDA